LARSRSQEDKLDAWGPLMHAKRDGVGSTLYKFEFELSPHPAAVARTIT
jgi:hypothetical protein